MRRPVNWIALSITLLFLIVGLSMGPSRVVPHRSAIDDAAEVARDRDERPAAVVLGSAVVAHDPGRAIEFGYIHADELDSPGH